MITMPAQPDDEDKRAVYRVNKFTGSRIDAV